METQIISTISDQDQDSNFKAFIRLLVQKFQPLQIFCFSKNNREEKNAGCFKVSEAKQHGLYCLLIVTETNDPIGFELEEFSNHNFKQGTITYVCNGRQYIANEINANSRFFITIYGTGQLLYSHDGIGQFDFNTQFMPLNAAPEARRHFNYRMPLAEDFLHGASACLDKQAFNISTFMLHQVVEQCSIVLIRVHLGYKSEIHNIRRLLYLCNSFSDRPMKLFLSGSLEDEKLFDVLLKSYSGARYKDYYTVQKSEAQDLYSRVSALVSLVKEMCNNKIEQLNNEAILYREFNAESEAKVA